MDTIRRQLGAIGLERVASEIQARSQPSLRLTAGKPSAQAVNRLGGRPNLPKELAWPVWQGGQPLAFIAQLDLATLSRVRGFPLSRNGSLFFFYDADTQPWGFDPKDKGCAQVIYSSSPLGANRLRTPHPDLDEEARFKGLGLEAALETSLPGVSDGLFRQAQLTAEEFKAYSNLMDPPGAASVHRLGGLADEIQGDVRLEAQLVSQGIYCGDPKGYKDGRERGLDAGADDWRLLLQVDSDDRAGMMWGDLGRLYFMIHKHDLRRCKFENVWLILQCD